MVCASAALVACGGDEPAARPPTEQPDASGSGGAQGCAPGEIDDGAGACTPAGVPPDLCATGFQPDPSEGCVPILPESPCVKGTMAVPGETSCHEVAPCQGGRWGSIPIDALT